jgi:hypothetical protein
LGYSFGGPDRASNRRVLCAALTGGYCGADEDTKTLYRLDEEDEAASLRILPMHTNDPWTSTHDGGSRQAAVSRRLRQEKECCGLLLPLQSGKGVDDRRRVHDEASSKRGTNPVISENVVVITKAEFESRIMDAFSRGRRQGILDATTPQRCHSGSDGDCSWQLCPQNRDGEPMKSGRHCPLDLDDPER